MASGSGWGQLPDGLLHSILDYIVPVDGRIKFSAVCSQWRRVAWEHCREMGSKHPQQLPLLMVPTPDNSTVRRSLYSVTHKTLCQSQLSVPYNKRCCGSSHGWLITVDDSFVVTLFNPFTGKIISFPPLRRLESEKWLLHECGEVDSLDYLKLLRAEFSSSERGEDDEEEINYDHYQEDEEEINDAEEEEETEGVPDCIKGVDIVSESDYSIWKGVLSVDPDLKPNGYVLMVIYGVEKRLAFIQSVDKDWTYISKRSCSTQDTRFSVFNNVDIKYSKGIFYALNEWGGLLSCDVRGSLKVKMVTPNDMSVSFPAERKLYLGESSGGDLLRVINLVDKKFRTIEFVVYGLGDGCDGAKWNEVKSIGDAALFLGDNDSITILASDFHGCQPNSIYFSHNHSDFLGTGAGSGPLELYYLQWGPYNIGVFNLEDGKVAQNYILDPSQRFLPPPIWIVPTFM